jgi:hypothetical protein
MPHAGQWRRREFAGVPGKIKPEEKLSRETASRMHVGRLIELSLFCQPSVIYLFRSLIKLVLALE